MGHGCGRTQDDGGAGSHERQLRQGDKRGFSIPPILGSTPQGLPGLIVGVRYGSDTSGRRALRACAVKG